MQTTIVPLLLLFLSVISASATAVAENQQPNDKALLIDVVENRYPQLHSSALECADLIPEFKNAQFDGGCMLSKRELPVMMFVGDSHMGHYKWTIVSKLQTESVGVIEQTNCLPFAVDKLLVEPSCQKKQELVLKYISQSPTIKTVVLSARWDAFMVGGDYDSSGENWRHARTPSEEDAKNFKANARKFISSVLNSGKQVVFMKDIPDLDFDIRTCYDVRPVKLTVAKIKQDCSLEQAVYEKRIAVYMTYLDQLLSEFPSLKVYDPRPLFCSRGRCVASDGTLPYYLNGDHVNLYGADMIINDLVKTLALKI